MIDKLEIGDTITCYRNYPCDWWNDRYKHAFVEEKGMWRLEIGQSYRVSGGGGLFMVHGIKNPFTGQEYKADINEIGFTISISYIPDSCAPWRSSEQIGFSLDPKSDIFYGKWFYDEVKYRDWKLKYLLDEER